MDVADASTSGTNAAAASTPPPFKPSCTPEVELYCFMLLLMYLMDGKKAQQVSGKSSTRVALKSRTAKQGLKQRTQAKVVMMHEDCTRRVERVHEQIMMPHCHHELMSCTINACAMLICHK